MNDEIANKEGILTKCRILIEKFYPSKNPDEEENAKYVMSIICNQAQILFEEAKKEKEKASSKISEAFAKKPPNQENEKIH
jgi:hypothetical protein